MGYSSLLSHIREGTLCVIPTMTSGSRGRDDTNLKREPRRIQLRLSLESAGRYGGRGQSKSAGERKLVVGSKEEQKEEEGL